MMSKPATKGWLLGLGLVITHGIALWLGMSSRPDAVGPGEEERAASSSAAGRVERTRRDRIDFPAAWDQLHRADISREEFEEQRKELIREWAARDLAAVLDKFFGPDVSRVYHPGMTGLFEDAIAARPVEMLDWIRAGKFGSARQEAFCLWFSVMSRNDRMLIVSELSGMTPYEMRWSVGQIHNRLNGEELREVRTQILKAEGDPAFLALSRKGLSGSYFASMRESYADRLLELGWGDAVTIIGEESDPNFQRALGDAWAGRAFGTNPDASSIGRLMELPAGARRGALEEIYNFADERGVAGVLPVMQELARLGAWEELAGEESKHALLVIAERKGDDQEEVRSWVSQLQDPRARVALIPEFAASYARRDEAGCVAWVRELAAANERDAAAVRIIRRWVGSDGLRKQLFGMIEDPGIAAELLKKWPDLGR